MDDGTVNNPLLQIIIASTRPGRAGLPIGRWTEQAAVAHGGFDVEVLDLHEIALPMFDEPVHPRLRQYTQEHTLAWSAMVDRGDAYVIVLPEYNHSYNGALKNALDFLVHEWSHKPVGLVSYGGVAGGIRAVQALKPALLALGMHPLVEAVVVPLFPRFLRGEGDARTFEPDEEITRSAGVMFDALARWIPASTLLRQG